MAGFFGTRAEAVVDFSLLLQIIILFVLFLGYKFKVDKKLRNHGIVMSIALFLHTFSILIVMVPSLLNYSGLLFTDFSNVLVIITWLHAPIGLLAVILGIFLVAKWKFDALVEKCAKRKHLMKPVMVLWIFSLFLGIAFYIYGYWL